MPPREEGTVSANQPWPNWQPNAMALTLASGISFAFPRNPTDYDDTQSQVATDRPTLDGYLTYVWTPDPQQITLQGFTREEGVAVWYGLRRDFQGKVATFEDALTGQRLAVLVQGVRIQASQKPATYRWQVQLKAAQ
jgi:hypothetical protein